MLEARQQLIGEPQGLTVSGNVLVPAGGSNPVIGNVDDDVVRLASGNVVDSVTLDPAGTGGGIAGGPGVGGMIMIDHVNVSDNGTSGSQPGVELDGTTGTFFISDMTVQTNGATGVRLNDAGTVYFQPVGTVSVSAAGAKALDAESTNMAQSVFDNVTVSGSPSGGVSLVNTGGTTQLGDGVGADLGLTTTSGTAPALLLDTAGTVSVPAPGTSNLSATGGPAIDARSTNAQISLDDVDSTNSANDGINVRVADGLSLAGDGSIKGDISGAAGISLDVAGGSASVIYRGALNDGSGQAVRVTDRTGGTVSVSGPIADTSDAGGGIQLLNNTGGSTYIGGSGTKVINTVGGGDAIAMTSSAGHRLSISGGLDIDTSSGRGLYVDGAAG